MPITANKGEWSELYVLFKLLADQKLHAGNAQLQRLETCYPVLQVLRDEVRNAQRSRLTYTPSADLVVLSEDGVEFARIPTTQFLEQTQKLFAAIQQGVGSFEIPQQAEFLERIHCEKIKAKSDDKSDIHVVLHDHRTGMRPKLGFSIKSEMGSAPTLLNASAATVITYSVDGECSETLAENINVIDGNNKLFARIAALYDHQLSLVKPTIANSNFANNLRMIDSHFPQMLSTMLLGAYRHQDMDLVNALERLQQQNPLHYARSGHDFYGYKLRSFLTAIALGMLPGSIWQGNYDATGGYIVVKADGELVCFHLYDRNLLEEYLLHNTKFETPSLSRYHAGQLYRNAQGEWCFDLVVQIRFK